MEQYAVLSPSANRHSSETPLPTPTQLRSVSATIGFVWHYGYRGDEMFAAIAEQFAAGHPQTTFVDYEVFGNIHGASETALVQMIPQKLREHKVAAVVAGVGG
jgi:hypothetical protein